MVLPDIRNRRSAGFSLASILQEYALLRNEIWQVIGNLLEGQVSAKELFTMERAINDALDRILEETLPTYLEEPRDTTP